MSGVLSPPSMLVTATLYDEVGLFVLVVVLLYLNAFMIRRHRRRIEPLLARGRELLVDLSTEPDLLESVESGKKIEALEAFKNLPRRVKKRLLFEMAWSVSGEQSRRLHCVAGAVGLLARAASDCRSWRWRRRVRGIRVFAALGGGEDIVPSLIGDRYPLVRSEAAEWATFHPDAAIIEELLNALDDPGGFNRFAQQDALLRMGDVVIVPLIARIERNFDRDVSALMTVAVGLRDVRLRDVALRLVGHAMPAVRAQAAALIGAITGDGAAELLQPMLEDADATVRAAAAASLGQLHHWPAATRVARLLDDPTWEVRYAAANSLRTMGSPGQLLLRRAAASSADNDAAEIARQMLERG